MIRRLSLPLDLELVARAQDVLGTKDTAETIHSALEDVVRRDRLRRLAAERFDDLTPETVKRLRSSR